MKMTFSYKNQDDVQRVRHKIRKDFNILHIINKITGKRLYENNVECEHTFEGNNQPNSPVNEKARNRRITTKFV